MIRPAAFGAVALVLSACAALPPEPESAALRECRARFISLDESTDVDGVRNAGAYRIPGFPYLRTNRFLASFADEARGDGFDAWVDQLREFGIESRGAELRNLGGHHVAHELNELDQCAREWAEHDLAVPGRRAELRRNARVPDDYSAWKRVLGVYPLAVPFMKLGIGGYQDGIREDYESPEDNEDVVLWARGPGPVASPRQAAAWLANATTDALGIPALPERQWWRIARLYAPAWAIQTRGEHDLPGRLGWRNGRASLDAGEPTVYFLRSYTRFRGQVLVQLVYVVWFSERPAQGWLDSYAGRLDGVVWRVTLGANGKPLVYDTIHPCGCYHLVFPARDLEMQPHGGFWEEPVLFPQDTLPRAPLALRVESGTHFVTRILGQRDLSPEGSRSYRLRDYRELLSLRDGGRRRSLFDADGLVAGTERFERWWLWPSGIASPGAMRQWGRHATAFVGRRHFDDPFLFDELFTEK